MSHNSLDKELARKLAAQLKLLGAKVWFDEWEIGTGDSISEAVGGGLQSADCFVLLWSANAARSRWVQSEMNATINAWLSGANKRIVPVRLDNTPVPPLLSDLKHVWFDERPLPELAGVILGVEGVRARGRAIQLAIDEHNLDIRDYYGYGPLVACPECGAGHDQIEAWRAVDQWRDDLYAGAKCKACGWNGGGEVPS